MSSAWSWSGAAVLSFAVRAVAWLPWDAPQWFALRVFVRVFGLVFAPAALYALPTDGAPVARSRPEQPSASSQLLPQRRGQAHRRLRVIAGTTPIPAGPRDSGTSARNADGLFRLRFGGMSMTS